MGQPVGLRHTASCRRCAATRPWRLSPGLLSVGIVLVSLIQIAAPSTERPGAAFTHGRAFFVGHAYAVCPHARQSGGGHLAGTQLRKNEGYGRLGLARGRTVRRADREVVAMSQSKDDATREALERVRLVGGLPQHLGIVMDGNRRYAKSRGCPTGWGHLKGKERLEQTIRWVLIDLQIPCLTVYALSLDNLAKRSPNEVAQLCDLIALGLDEMRCSDDFKQHDIRVKIAGATEALPDRLRESVRAVEDETKERGSGGQLTLCIGYGGREDLVAAARRMAKDYADGILVESEMTEGALGERLWTADLPDADLVIRTSGEERISNFLLWQIAYAELFFSPLPWPAFDAEALIRALEHYTHRHRRFGQ